MIGIGFVEFLVLFFPFLFGNGVPLGCPPGENDPVLLNVATEDCVAFGYWAGRGEINPNSDPTQKFMAQPELSDFFTKLRATLKKEMIEDISSENLKIAQSLSELVDEAAWGLFSRPSCVFLADFAIVENNGIFDRNAPPKMDGVIINNLGTERARIERAWNELVNVGTQDPESLTMTKIGNVDLVHLLELSRDTPVFLTVRDGYILIGLGTKSISEVNLKETGTANHPKWLDRIQQDIPIERQSSLAFFNGTKVQKWVEKVLKDAGRGDPASEYLLRQFLLLKSISFTTGFDKLGYMSRWKIDATPAEDSIINSFDAGPISQNLLKAIPSEITGSFAMRLKADSFLDQVKSIVETSMGEGANFEQMLDSADEFLGVKIRDDIVHSMDDFVFFYSKFAVIDPIKGWVMGVRLRDEMSFQDTLNRISIRVGKYCEDNGLQFKEITNNDITIRSLSSGEFGFPPSISYAIVEKYFLVSLDESTIGNFARNLKKGESMDKKVETTELYEYFAKNKLPEPIFVAELNTSEILAMAYPFLMQFLGDQPITPGGQMKLSAIPALDVLTKDVKPMQLAVVRTDSGFQVVQRSTYPGASAIPSTAAFLALGLEYNVSSMGQSKRHATANNLRQLVIALHNYHDAYRALPSSYSTDDNGKPLLSWRVHILPFLEQGDELYKQFHLDEPWDSEHNLKLAAKMPECFRHPLAKVPEGKTVYLGVSGKNGVFKMPKAKSKGNRLENILDGTSATIMIVECIPEIAVTWTQPSDFDFENVQGSVRDKLFNFGQSKMSHSAFCDGSTHDISPNVDDKLLRAFMTTNGAEVVNVDDLKK